MLGERFSCWPGKLRDVPADEYYRFVNMMGLEGEIKAALMGLEPDEHFEREE